jgi:hypothetical protein
MKVIKREAMENGDATSDYKGTIIRTTYSDGSYRDFREDEFDIVRNPDGTRTAINNGGKPLTPFNRIDLRWIRKYAQNPRWALHEAVIICFAYAPTNFSGLGGELSREQKKDNLEALKQVQDGMFVYQTALTEIQKTSSTYPCKFEFNCLSDGWGGKIYQVEPYSFINWFLKIEGLQTSDVVNSANFPNTSAIKAQVSKPDYTTPAMELMYRAVDKFWKDYKPGESTPPKSSTVKSWLNTEAIIVNNGLNPNDHITTNTCSDIDRLIRHPSAARGGNRKVKQPSEG